MITRKSSKSFRRFFLLLFLRVTVDRPPSKHCELYQWPCSASIHSYQLFLFNLCGFAILCSTTCRLYRYPFYVWPYNDQIHSPNFFTILFLDVLIDFSEHLSLRLLYNNCGRLCGRFGVLQSNLDVFQSLDV